MRSKARQNIQKYSEKVFKRLIVQFLEFLDSNHKATDEEIEQKKTELNNKWVEHCLNNPFIKTDGSEVFLHEINKILQDQEMVDILNARKEAP